MSERISIGGAFLPRAARQLGIGPCCIGLGCGCYAAEHGGGIDFVDVATARAFVFHALNLAIAGYFSRSFSKEATTGIPVPCRPHASALQDPQRGFFVPGTLSPTVFRSLRFPNARPEAPTFFFQGISTFSPLFRASRTCCPGAPLDFRGRAFPASSLSQGLPYLCANIIAESPRIVTQKVRSRSRLAVIRGGAAWNRMLPKGCHALRDGATSWHPFGMSEGRTGRTGWTEWSLVGCRLYHLISGKPPYVGNIGGGDGEAFERTGAGHEPSMARAPGGIAWRLLLATRITGPGTPPPGKQKLRLRPLCDQR
jgi:hypothetical protein